MDVGVGDKDRAPFRDHHLEADDPFARVGVDHPGDVLQGNGKTAGRAGDHGIGVPLHHHAGGKYIPVLIDQPLAVPEQVTLPLQPGI